MTGRKPQPRFQWTVTRFGLSLLFAFLHATLLAALVILYVECVEPGAADEYSNELGPSDEAAAVACLVYTGPLFGVLWMLAFVRLMKRYSGGAGRCSFCGWKLRAPSNPCLGCGAWPVRFCQNCRYDLTGNVSGVCPECGERVAADGAASEDEME